MSNAFEDIVASFTRKGKLVTAHLDLTYRCDLDCIHCYLDDRSKRGPDTETWLSVVDDLATMGCFALTFSGGEIFLRKDIWEILGRARGHRFYVRLKTHGRFIDGPVAERLREHGIHSVDLSVYSLQPHVHDRIVRRRGALEGTLAAVDHLLGVGIRVKVHCTVMKENFGAHRELFAAMEARGVDCVYDGTIRGTQSGGTEVYGVGLCLPDLIHLEADRLSDGGPTRGHAPRPLSEDTLCGAGNFSLYVDPDGNVTPCVAWPMPLGNIADQPVSRIWAESKKLKAIKAIRRSDRTLCDGCSYRGHCSYCPGMAYLERRNFIGPAETLCRSAQARFLAQKHSRPGEALRRAFLPIAKNRSNPEHAAEILALLDEDGGVGAGPAGAGPG